MPAPVTLGTITGPPPVALSRVAPEAIVTPLVAAMAFWVDKDVDPAESVVDPVYVPVLPMDKLSAPDFVMFPVPDIPPFRFRLVLVTLIEMLSFRTIGQLKRVDASVFEREAEPLETSNIKLFPEANEYRLDAWLATFTVPTVISWPKVTTTGSAATLLGKVARASMALGNDPSQLPLSFQFASSAAVQVTENKDRGASNDKVRLVLKNYCNLYIDLLNPSLSTKL